MPGILPMKVIKVGNSSQSRIAQACDRCRSKKIRCDGIRPTCSQCANVGFECRTSDKLSRRAFPRGYTESLEERVRALESEVRELKDLLDEKDEKIDMLSKMHANRRRRPSGSSQGASGSPDMDKNAQAVKEDTFRIQASPLLLGVENSDSYFMGSSSGRAFIEAFKRKVQETGKPCGDFNPEAFLHTQGCRPLSSEFPDQLLRPPPRIFSDRCVNVYFQEWAPLFPVLHKPTFLRTYEEFGADPDKVKSPYKVAQLYLVFSIAGLSSNSPDMRQLAICERQWTQAIDALLMDNTMSTLQCLILAILYCIMRADYKRLQHYKGIAVSLSHRLGLHQSQKRFSFGALTIETRKKVFWTLYTLDCFSAATLGLPKLLKEEDVQTEYPSDTDDEYVTEKGFQPTLPGEFTRLSSALALFKAARILARVLEKVYPATTPHELSMQQLGAFAGELDAWYDNLPVHLRLNFAQDKPSTDVTTSRSPLLALAYHYIRTLIYRPAVGSTLGPKAAPALLSIGDSSKRAVQIVQLLEERSMTFSFCLNKFDILLMCGMTLLYRTVDLSKDSKLVRDDERLVNAISKIIGKAEVPGLAEFRRIANMLVSLDDAQMMAPPSKSPGAIVQSPTVATHKLQAKSPTQQKAKYSSIGRNTDATVSESDLLQQQEKLRRMTMSSLEGPRPLSRHAPLRQSFDGLRHNPRQEQLQQSPRSNHGSPPVPRSRPSTEYMQHHSTPPAAQSLGPVVTQHSRALANAFAMGKSYGMAEQDWETMLGSMDSGVNNVYDAIYGGPGLAYEPSVSTNASSSGWSPDTVDLSTFSIGDLDNFTGPAHSVHSLSDESLSSGEEVAPSELGLTVGDVDYQNQVLTGNCGNGETFVLGGLELFPL